MESDGPPFGAVNMSTTGIEITWITSSRSSINESSTEKSKTTIKSSKDIFDKSRVQKTKNPQFHRGFNKPMNRSKGNH